MDMKKVLLASAEFVGIPLAAYVNANAASKLYVCATPQNVDLIQVDFEALTWVEVKGIGSHGEAGSSTNILTYDTWDTVVMQKAKGITDAGSPELEVARLPYDAGQAILRTAAADTAGNNYAFKMVRNDPVVVGNAPTIIYNRGIVTGPRRPFGRNEDFDLEIFTFGFNQKEVVVNPITSGTAPANTAAPSITGTAKVGTTLTLSNGTFTGSPTPTYAYRWYAGGVLIIGANANTYVPVSGDIGKVIQGQVIATNTAGQATAFSAPTAAVVP